METWSEERIGAADRERGWSQGTGRPQAATAVSRQAARWTGSGTGAEGLRPGPIPAPLVG